MKYGLEEKPGIVALLLYGLQWWVVSLPSCIIMGLVVAKLHYADSGLQTLYLQKVFGVTGLATLVQVLLGHRLPLVVGPAATLLVGVIAGAASGANAVYTAIFLGGMTLSVLAYSGLLSRFRFFFTPRIIAVILLLVAVSLSPTILRLILAEAGKSTFQLCFALLTVFVLLLCNNRLHGMWKSLTVIIGMGGGSLAYFYFSGFPSLPAPGSGAGFFASLPVFEFHLGTFVSFVFCFFALVINEFGSLESLGHMLRVDNMPQRIRKGIGLQGIASMAAGGIGVIGSVDYSLSAGVISATGCASRFTLAPAGLGLILCSFSSDIVLVLSCIPGPVMGAVMLYLMASQMTSGLSMLVAEKGISDFNAGMTVSLPLMVGLLISFCPSTAFDGFPDMLRPIVNNGFVMGTITVIILEHLVFRSKT